MKFEKITTDNGDGTFSGHLVGDGKKIKDSDRTAKSKIGIGSVLGTLLKNLPDPVEFEDEEPSGIKNVSVVSEPPKEKPSKPVMNETAAMESIAEETIIAMDAASGDDSTVVATVKDGEIIKVEEVKSEPAPKEQKMLVSTGTSNKSEQRTAYLKRLKDRSVETIQMGNTQVHVIESNWASSLKMRHGAVEYSIEIVSPSEIFISRTTDPALGVCYFDIHMPKFVDWLNNGLELGDTGQTIHNIEKLKYTMLVWNFSNYRILSILK